MFVDLPQQLMLYTAGAFLLAKIRATQRERRDNRIRQLEAELRIARGDSEKSRMSLEKLEECLKETTVGLERRDIVISEQQAKLDKAKNDLKDSVIKTRQLRAELTERATQSVHAEAKIREVETELSVAQASTDMIATGVLDYSLAPDKEDEESANQEGGVTKTAS